MHRVISSSWAAFALFYLAMTALVSFLDWANQVFYWPLWLTQMGLVTLGMIIFGLVSWRWPVISPQVSAVLAFTVGILTIVPATLMGLGPIEGLWPQYFLVAFGMAAGSILGFLFVHTFSQGHRGQSSAEKEREEGN
jgi:hypothetical protein